MSDNLVLYRIFDASGDLLYVGSTVDIERRLAEHHRYAPFRDAIGSVTVHRGFGSLAEMRTAEADAIRDETPPFNTNKYLNGGGPNPALVLDRREADWLTHHCAVGRAADTVRRIEAQRGSRLEPGDTVDIHDLGELGRTNLEFVQAYRELVDERGVTLLINGQPAPEVTCGAFVTRCRLITLA